MNLTDLGIKLRKARTMKKMTQKQLGKIIGVVESTVRMWELGKNKPSPKMLQSLSRYLDIPLYELMSMAGYMDDRTLIDVIISEIGKNTLEIESIKELIVDYENRAKKAEENNIKDKGYTAEEYLAERDNLTKHLNVRKNRQKQLRNKIFSLPGSEDLLLEILTETQGNNISIEKDEKHIKDIYFDFFQLEDKNYELFYKRKLITSTQINDIMKFIETFIIDKEGD